MYRSVIITGIVGSGKSTVGKLLAHELEMRFVDLDELITRRHGLTPQQIFGTYGEHYFRQLEHEAFKEIVEWQGYVIATGGGTLINPQNYNILSPQNLLICLDCDPEALWQRLEPMQDRPVLLDPERTRKAKLFFLIETRHDVYAKIKYHIDTTDRLIESVVEEAICIYQS